MINGVCFMAKGHDFINIEINLPEPDSGNADNRQADKALVDLFLLLHEWNERAEKADAKIQKDI
jgi:hypothetical protein